MLIFSAAENEEALVDTLQMEEEVDQAEKANGKNDFVLQFLVKFFCITYVCCSLINYYLHSFVALCQID